MPSFIGFLPAESPRLSAIVVLDAPVGAYYGGVVSAPMFAALGSFGIRNFHIPAEPGGVPPRRTPAGPVSLPGPLPPAPATTLGISPTTRP